MLPLDSPRWRTLKTFCDSGLKLRELVRRWHDVVGTPEAKAVYGELRDYFTHQYSMVDAAYAVIPHVVEELERLTPKDRILPLIDIGITELATYSPHEPPMPADLEEDYSAALKKATKIAERCLSYKLSKEDFRYLLAVISILRGHPKLGELLVHLHAVQEKCPKCGTTVYPKEIKDSGY